MKKSLFVVLIFILSAVANAQNSTLQTANDYIFSPGNEVTLPPGGTTTLGIKQITKDNYPADAVIESEQWTIDGKSISNQNHEEGDFKLGTLQPDKGNYTAPSKVPPHNPVVITLSFQPQGEKIKIILYCRIHVIDKENYFYLSSSRSHEGSLYELKEPALVSSRNLQETATYMNDQWNIGANGFRKMDDNTSMQFMGIGISINGNATGNYQWSVRWNDKQGVIPPDNSVTITGTGNDETPSQYSSIDCRPHGSNDCKPVALEGSTTINVFDKKNKTIKGYFSGILMSPKYEYTSVSGVFSVHIN